MILWIEERSRGDLVLAWQIEAMHRTKTLPKNPSDMWKDKGVGPDGVDTLLAQAQSYQKAQDRVRERTKAARVVAESRKRRTKDTKPHGRTGR